MQEIYTILCHDQFANVFSPDNLVPLPHAQARTTNQLFIQNLSQMNMILKTANNVHVHIFKIRGGTYF